MTETNDLLKRIERGLNDLPTLAMDDIKAYGKAEFERGRKTGYTEHEFYIDTSFYDLSDENKKLKDQNKELMRENLKLIATKHCCSHQEACERRSEFMDFAKEVLSWGPVHDPEEFPNCRIDINAVLKELDSLGQKKPEPEWYDAEKCLPLLNKWVKIQLEDIDGSIKEIDYAQLKIHKNKYSWFEVFYSDIYEDECLEAKDYKVLKWRYADE